LRLVKRVEDAGDIIERVRGETKEVLGRIARL
jgi:hypothetical protein